MRINIGQIQQNSVDLKIIYKTIFSLITIIFLVESVALSCITYNAFDAVKINDKMKQLMITTCHPYVDSTWFIHNDQIYVVCYSDETLSGFSIQHAKYKNYL